MTTSWFTKQRTVIRAAWLAHVCSSAVAGPHGAAICKYSHQRTSTCSSSSAS